MKIYESIAKWRTFRTQAKVSDLSLGFVPTMGALHKGHFSLVERSLKENRQTLVSIFVNPTQFNDPRDLEKYPRTLEKDAAALDKLGVDFLLAPKNPNEVYPDHYRYQLSETSLSQELCGASRPGHFSGMLSVVLKLLNLAQAQRAYFGEKDYQQLQLVRGMVEAFFLPTEIVACPTVREADGLAMSSRNQRLSPESREKASRFAKILLDPARSLSEVEAALIEEGFEVDYVQERDGRRFGAVILEGVRLIDNFQIDANKGN